MGRIFRQGWNGTSGPCLACSQPHAGPTGAFPLCAACCEAIPWIRHIACATCGRYEPCGDCPRRKDTYFVFSRSAVKYDAAMKQWLARWKYRGDERMLAVFEEMLVQAYWNVAAELRLDGRAIDAIIHVPLSRQRLEERGFNQAERLARALSRRVQLPVLNLLTRTRHTDKQSLKTRAERLNDLQNAFAVVPEAVREWNAVPRERPARMLLMDDVYTTGSTLNQCAKAIVESTGAEVYGLTWAR